MIEFEKQLDERINKFYEDYFSKEAKKLSDPEKILDYCLSKAWADATQRERFNGQKSKIIEHKQDIIGKLKTEIETGIRTKNFFLDYDKWHDEMCNNKDYKMTYGIWQKFINMTFKYMRCSNKFPEMELLWSQCHCPIDRIIAQRADTLCIICGLKRSEKMKSIAESGEFNWNKMETKDQYDEVRNKIREITKKCIINNSATEHPTELEFDFLLW